MKIAGIQKSSTIDYPGHLSCVLFTPGCNLDCFYCHNRALLEGGAPLLDEAEVFAFLQKRSGLLDGVVISGGEPTLQSDLKEFIQKLRELNYEIKLDTNGQNIPVLAPLLSEGLIDYLAVDIKALPEQYESVCKKDGYENAVSVLRLAMEAGVACEGRTTVYPGMRPDMLLSLAKQMPRLPRWRLNVYHTPAQYKPEDELRVRIAALSETELAHSLPELEIFQPGVCL